MSSLEYNLTILQLEKNKLYAREYGGLFKLDGIELQTFYNNEWNLCVKFIQPNDKGFREIDKEEINNEQ